MEFVADILLVAGALGAGLYCFVLARRLSRFNDLEKGVGGAVAVLSAQVDDLTRALGSAQMATDNSAETIADLTARAEDVSHRLEVMMAALQDMPELGEPETSRTEKHQNASRSREPMFMRHANLAGRRQ